MPPRRTWYTIFGKRALDLSIAAPALVALAPLMAGIAALIRIKHGPGVLYRQTRIGRHGEPFTMYKFRTMRPDRRQAVLHPYTGEERRRSHKSVDDPRHTNVGRLLRRTSLDELPQLINVLRGEMSLVGPRPEVQSVVRQYERWQHKRHSVRPGITGLWQITARNDATAPEMHRYVHLDLDYLRDVSLRRDLSILRQTMSGVASFRFRGR